MGRRSFSGIVGGDGRISLMAFGSNRRQGHTPGHVAIHLESQGEHAVMWGDLCHSPAQCHRPDWSYRRDWDGVLSTVSRTRVLRSCVEHGHMVLSSHFPAPSVGRIHDDGEGFRFDYDRME